MAEIGDVLGGRYRLESLIARGGMADVYRGYDDRLGRDVAIKILREVEHERRFEAEARTLANLSHPNLVPLLDAGTEGDSAYLVLELLEGVTVATLLRDGPLGDARTRDVGVAVAGALAYIHERGIVHRDVKPSNLMLDARGTVRLADFGIARLIGGTSLTGTQQTVGTMAYLAPEQLRGDQVTPAADIYSLGLVLLECLTGRRAFAGTAAEAGLNRLARDPDVPTTLAPPWRRLLATMTAGDPGYRPDAAEVGARLEGREPDAAATVAATRAAGVIDPTPTAVAPVGPEERRRDRPALWWTLAVVAVLALAALVIFLVLTLRDDGDEPGPSTTTTSTTTTTTTTPTTSTTTTPTTTTAPPTTTTAPPTTTTAPSTTTT